MANTARVGITKLEATDPPRSDIDVNTALDQIDASMAIDSQGPVSSRPNPGVPGRYFTATDQGNALYRDNGTTWVPIGPSVILPGSIGTTELANGSVTNSKLANTSVDTSKLANSLKPSFGAGPSTETLRSLGGNANQAYPGNLGVSLDARTIAMLTGTYHILASYVRTKPIIEPLSGGEGEFYRLNKLTPYTIAIVPNMGLPAIPGYSIVTRLVGHLGYSFPSTGSVQFAINSGSFMLPLTLSSNMNGTYNVNIAYMTQTTPISAGLMSFQVMVDSFIENPIGSLKINCLYLMAAYH